MNEFGQNILKLHLIAGVKENENFKELNFHAFKLFFECLKISIFSLS